MLKACFGSFDLLEIKSQLGETVVLPEHLFGDTTGRLSEKTGIPKLNRSKKTAFELALEAGKKSTLLPQVRDKIGGVIFVTQSASNYLPNHASEIQSALSINQNSICFDINQGCSGFVQALFLAIKLLQNCEYLVIICADTYSHHLSEDDRSTQSLFSDGATFTILSSNPRWCLKSFSHLTDGSGSNFLYKEINEDKKLVMNGPAVFLWTRRVLGQQILEMLEKADIKKDDVNNFFLHQASKFVLDNVQKGLSVSAEKIPTSLHLTGNLVSSSIPYLIENNFENFKNGKLNVLSGFGVGLSCSSLVIESM